MLYELGSLFGGLLLLVYGSDRTVASASAFAHALGVSTLFIGITIVAVGS
ncbi:MAG: Ca2+/Na+ antiporter, partial [Natronomonas sp.]